MVDPPSKYAYRSAMFGGPLIVMQGAPFGTVWHEHRVTACRRLQRLVCSGCGAGPGDGCGVEAAARQLLEQAQHASAALAAAGLPTVIFPGLHAAAAQ